MAHFHIPIYNIRPTRTEDTVDTTPYYNFYETFECMAKDSMLAEYGYME